MQELKPNWKMALQISLLHTRTANQITATLIFIALIISAIILKLSGHALSLALFVEYFTRYRAIIIPVLLLIHFIPVNLYAIIQVLKHPYAKFRILILSPEKSHETDRRDDKTF